MLTRAGNAEYCGCLERCKGFVSHHREPSGCMSIDIAGLV